MRYVIAVCLVTGFLIWDGISNDGRYVDLTVRELRHLASVLGALSLPAARASPCSQCLLRCAVWAH